MSEKNILFQTNTQKLSLKSNWILKNDGDRIILYLLSSIDFSYFDLSPASGIILSLFNGIRTIEEIVEVVRFIFGCSQEIANDYIQQLLRQLQDKSSFPIIAKYPVLISVTSRNQIRSDLDPFEFIPSLNPQPKSGLRLNSPVSLMLFFTNLCQTDCRYCYAERRHIPNSELLSLWDWRRILEQAKDIGIKKITLTGGDVFAHPNGIDFIELLIEFDMLFFISTKCLISKEYTKRLVNAGFCEPVHGVKRDIQFSLDSCDPKIAAFLTKRSDFLVRAKISIQNLVDAGINPKVKAVLTPFNFHGLDKFVEEMRLLGVNRINFTLYEPGFYRHSDDLSLSDIQKAEVASVISTFPDKYPEIEFDGDAMSFAAGKGLEMRGGDKWRFRAGCSGGRIELGITADGKAVLCEQTPQDTPFIFGDLRKSSILEIWNSQDLLDFIFPPRNNFVGTVCFDCHEFFHCQHELGSCFRDTFFATGTPFEATPSCPYREKIPRIGSWRYKYIEGSPGLSNIRSDSSSH